jgi:hypothetical protein
MPAVLGALGVAAVLGIAGYGACLAGVYRVAGALIGAMWVITCATGALVLAGVA